MSGLRENDLDFPAHSALGAQTMVCDASSVRLEGLPLLDCLCLSVTYRSAQHSDASAGREITAAFPLVNVLLNTIY